MTDDLREFGQLEARVEGLTASFEDFRREMRVAVLRLEETINTRLSLTDSKLHERLSNHASRIATLERWRAGIMAVTAAVAAVAGSMIAALLAWLRESR